MASDLINITVQNNTLIRILLLGFLGFLTSMLITPLYTALAYRGHWWKKPRSQAITGETATVFNHLHAAKHKRHIPTMAGIIFVLSTAVVTLLTNLSRPETWLPLAAMVGAGLIGLIDDVINIRGLGGALAGLKTKVKAFLLFMVGLTGGWWFFAKLDVTSVHIPLADVQLQLGWLIIPLFALVIFSTASAVNFTDGLDGLAGGLLTSAFGVYAIIAFLEGRLGVAAFCLTIVGALLSYTWFNIFPARFFMGDVGSFALGTALGVVAMLTDTIVLLPIIGMVFVAEAGSVILQIFSKKLRGGKKIFKSTPFHFHFQANGWPETKVTMRFWIIGQVSAVLGLILFLFGNYL